MDKIATLRVLQRLERHQLDVGVRLQAVYDGLEGSLDRWRRLDVAVRREEADSERSIGRDVDWSPGGRNETRVDLPGLRVENRLHDEVQISTRVSHGSDGCTDGLRAGLTALVAELRDPSGGRLKGEEVVVACRYSDAATFGKRRVAASEDRKEEGDGRGIGAKLTDVGS